MVNIAHTTNRSGPLTGPRSAGSITAHAVLVELRRKMMQTSFSSWCRCSTWFIRSTRIASSSPTSNGAAWHRSFSTPSSTSKSTCSTNTAIPSPRPRYQYHSENLQPFVSTFGLLYFSFDKSHVKSPKKQGGATVDIESRDCPAMARFPPVHGSLSRWIRRITSRSVIGNDTRRRSTKCSCPRTLRRKIYEGIVGWALGDISRWSGHPGPSPPCLLFF